MSVPICLSFLWFGLVFCCCDFVLFFFSVSCFECVGQGRPQPHGTQTQTCTAPLVGFGSFGVAAAGLKPHQGACCCAVACLFCSWAAPTPPITLASPSYILVFQGRGGSGWLVLSVFLPINNNPAVHLLHRHRPPPTTPSICCSCYESRAINLLLALLLHYPKMLKLGHESPRRPLLVVAGGGKKREGHRQVFDRPNHRPIRDPPPPFPPPAPDQHEHNARHGACADAFRPCPAV
jgi:hypothetical protein